VYSHEQRIGSGFRIWFFKRSNYSGQHDSVRELQRHDHDTECVSVRGQSGLESKFSIGDDPTRFDEHKSVIAGSRNDFAEYDGPWKQFRGNTANLAALTQQRYATNPRNHDCSGFDDITRFDVNSAGNSASQLGRNRAPSRISLSPRSRV
jgi:hypothetical protein